ncbi:MAG: hypothetical protein IKK75_11385 [Clostridia bacterium]|nr:hypothetical protein [Clostridia bacterium]
MKKILSAIIVAMLLMSLTMSAFAATGLGSYTTVKVTPATADKAGSVAVDTYMCAVTLDEEGKIVAVSFDVVQSKGGFDATGAVAGEAVIEPQTKGELKEGYGMKAISPIGKEYYEQMDALAAWCIGKTVEEVIALSADDADLKAGCTVGIADHLIVLQKAAANAK